MHGKVSCHKNHIWVVMMIFITRIETYWNALSLNKGWIKYKHQLNKKYSCKMWKMQIFEDLPTQSNKCCGGGIYLSLNVQLLPGHRAKSVQLPPQSPGRLCFGIPPGKGRFLFSARIWHTHHTNTLLANLSLANMEVLVAVVDDGAVLAAGADVANTLCGDEEHNNEKTQNRLQL